MQHNRYLLPYGTHRPELMDLEDEISELVAHISAATFRLLELIRQFDERRGWVGPGLRSCAHWLSWKCGLSMGTAREKVRVAHALPELSKISSRFREGRITYSKVRAITRVATPENEDYLLEIAEYGSTAQVEKLVRLYRRVKRTEALTREIERHRQRKVTWYEDESGCLVIRARLTPEQSDLVMKALDAAGDELFAERSEAEDEEATETFAARRADALERIALSYLNRTEAEGTGGDRYMVHVHTDLDTLKADGEGAEAELEDRCCVSAETSRRMACDSSVLRYLYDEQGEPLNIGRKTRTIPPAIRRALKQRDGGCTFPGCTCTRFLDAHHIQHWADEGQTSMDNLLLLCPYHHRLVHEGGYQVVRHEEQIQFRTPTGAVIPAVPETRFSGNVVSLHRQNKERGLEIDHASCLPRTPGAPMDYGTAVAALIFRE